MMNRKGFFSKFFTAAAGVVIAPYLPEKKNVVIEDSRDVTWTGKTYIKGSDLLTGVNGKRKIHMRDLVRSNYDANK